MKWDSSDERDNRIVDKGRWYDLSQVNDKAPARAGVYVFVNSDKQVKYVGKAGAGRLKDEINNAIYRNKDYGASEFGWFATNSDEYAKSLEQDWKEKYNPPNNIR